jgi:hypothetical protein
MSGEYYDLPEVRLYRVQIRLKRELVEADNDDTLKVWVCLELFCNFPKGDERGTFDGEAVRAGADRGKRDTRQRMLSCKLEGIPVTIGEQLVFVLVPSVPNGTHGMDNVLRRKIIAFRDFCPAGRASVEGAAFLEESGPGCAVDCAIDASTTQQRGIRRVDNRVDGLLCDVALKNGESVN